MSRKPHRNLLYVRGTYTAPAHDIFPRGSFYSEMKCAQLLSWTFNTAVCFTRTVLIMPSVALSLGLPGVRLVPTICGGYSVQQIYLNCTSGKLKKKLPVSFQRYIAIIERWPKKGLSAHSSESKHTGE